MNVPLLRQPTGIACGVTCLGMVLRRQQGWQPSFRDLAHACSLSRDGSSIRQLVEGAQQLGCKAKALRKGWRGLQADQLPLIVFVNYCHFVVLVAIDHEQALIHDPAQGKRKVNRAAFEEMSTGIMIRVSVPERPSSAVQAWLEPLLWRRWWWPAERRWWRRRDASEVIQRLDPDQTA